MRRDRGRHLRDSPHAGEAVNYIWARAIVLSALLCFASLRAWLERSPMDGVRMVPSGAAGQRRSGGFSGGAVDARTEATQSAARDAGSGGGRRPAGDLCNQGRGRRARRIPGRITPWNYLLAQGAVIIRYLRLLVVPYGFTVDPDVRVPPLWLCLLAWLAVAAFLVIVWRYAGKQVADVHARGPGAAAAQFLHLSAADLGDDRRMYLPMLAFAAALGILRGEAGHTDSLRALRKQLRARAAGQAARAESLA